jgi:hypothetical protein
LYRKGIVFLKFFRFSPGGENSLSEGQVYGMPFPKKNLDLEPKGPESAENCQSKSAVTRMKIYAQKTKGRKLQVVSRRKRLNGA